MRAFIAIEIPSEVKSALAVFQSEMRSVGADVGWTKPETMHLTLKFLGETPEPLIEKIEKICFGLAAEYQPFALSLYGVGVFPNARKPRVLWVGLSGEVEKTAEMQRLLNERLAPLGFEPETKDFNPHLTLCRVKSDKKVRELVARANAYQFPALTFDIREIVLMKSELDPAGARYTCLTKVPLR
jgi:RNA 2',3'-cyclic 3'-phosphodiesterase